MKSEQQWRKSDIVRAAYWVLFSDYSVAILNLVANLVLARLLLPEDFGLFATILAIVEVASIGLAWGTELALLSRKRISLALLSSARALSIVFGVFTILVVALALSPERRLHGVLLAGSVFLSNLATLNLTLLQRRLDLKRQGYVNLAGSIASNLVSITIAWRFRSVYALSLGQLVNGVVFFVLTSSWMKAFDEVALKSKKAGPTLKHAFYLLKRGRGYLGSRALEVGTSRVDVLVLNTFLPLSAIGVFSRVAKLNEIVQRAVSPVIVKLSLPLYALAEKKGFSRTKLQALIIWPTVRIVLPFMAVFGLLSDVVVDVLLGPQWKAAIPALRFAAPAVVMVPLLENLKMRLMADGKFTGLIMLRMLQVTVYLGLAVAFGKHLGVPGVSIAQVIGLASALFVGVLSSSPDERRSYAESFGWEGALFGIALVCAIYSYSSFVEGMSLLLRSLAVGGFLLVWGLLSWSFSPPFFRKLVLSFRGAT